MLGILPLVQDRKCRLEKEAKLSPAKVMFLGSCLEIQEQEDDTREEEAARQKEFLEKVVISQKGQLRQLEKVRKISDCGGEAG